MNFLDDLKDIKKELQKQQALTKSKNKASKSGMSMKNMDLEKIQKNLKQENQEKKYDEEMKELFLKEEKLANEFMEFIKNSDIRKI